MAATNTCPSQATPIDNVLWRRAIAFLYGLVANGVGVPPSAIAPTGSPFVYANADNFQEDIVIQGGTVSAVSFSRGGSTYYPVGFTSGILRLNVGDYVKIVYTVAPTVTKIPR